MGISFNPATLLSGSGLDVQSVVTALLAPENSSIQLLQTQQTDLTTQAGLLTQYNNDLNSLATAVSALADPNGALAAQDATSSQPSILTATAQSTALPGT